MQVGILQFSTPQFVARHFDIRLLHAFATEAFVQPVAVVQHVVGRYYHDQQDQQQNDGNALVGARLLHGAAIVCQGIVSTHLLEQLGVHLIIIRVERPFVERQSSHRTLVADVEHYLVVGDHRVVVPLYLRRIAARIAIAYHQQTSVGVLFLVVSIQVMAAGVSKLQRTGVCAVDVGEVGRVSKDMGTREVVGRLYAQTTHQQHDGHHHLT